MSGLWLAMLYGLEPYHVAEVGNDGWVEYGLFEARPGADLPETASRRFVIAHRFIRGGNPSLLLDPTEEELKLYRVAANSGRQQERAISRVNLRAIPKIVRWGSSYKEVEAKAVAERACPDCESPAGQRCSPGGWATCLSRLVEEGQPW